MPWFAGVERHQVNWQPTIEPSRCIGCGICLNCGKNVFDWLPDEEKAVVARPLDCVVGCNTCANLCHGRAISFPEVKELLIFYAHNHIWDHVKAALISEGKLPQRKES
jgi:NAD-dependent dihydropyrimidine dehydrogenase PreA subunit